MTTTDKFYTFHKSNQHVYKNLVAMARQYRRRHGKNSKVGIKMLWEKLRWDYRMSTDHCEFKLNNNYPAYYARLIMQANDDLNGVFELRERSAA